MEINKKTVKKLDGKKLSTIVEKYQFGIDGFLTVDGSEEMAERTYEVLKNNKVSLKLLTKDPNYDFVLTVDNYEAYCVYDY